MHVNLFLKFFLVGTAVGQSFSPCPFLGPVYPSPRDFANDPIWVNAVANLTNILKTSALGQNTTSLAIQVTGAENQKPLFEYYQTAPGHKYGPEGKSQVDKNTVFRIASVSKMFTIYALLVKCGFKCFEDSIIDYVPELRGAHGGDVIDSVEWEELTIGALAAQLSGIGRDCRCHNLSGVYICL
jgi:hypothetical protein